MLAPRSAYMAFMIMRLEIFISRSRSRTCLRAWGPRSKLAVAATTFSVNAKEALLFLQSMPKIFDHVLAFVDCCDDLLTLVYLFISGPGSDKRSVTSAMQSSKQ